MRVQSEFSTDDWLDRVQQAVREVSLAPRELPLDGVIARLSRLQAEGADHQIDAPLLEQVNRNFAQLIFTESMRRRLSLEVCRQHFAAVCEAGFFHPQHRCQFHEFFARYCYESGQREESQQMLSALREEIVTNIPAEENGSWEREELARIDALLSGIAANQLPATWLSSNRVTSG